MKLFRILPFASLLFIATATTACLDDDAPYSPGRPAPSTKYIRDGITPPGFEQINVDMNEELAWSGPDQVGPSDSNGHTVPRPTQDPPLAVSHGPDAEPASATAESPTGVCACEDQACVQEIISHAFGCNVCVMYICDDGRMGGCVSCDEEPSDDTTGE